MHAYDDSPRLIHFQFSLGVNKKRFDKCALCSYLLRLAAGITLAGGTLSLTEISSVCRYDYTH